MTLCLPLGRGPQGLREHLGVEATGLALRNRDRPGARGRGGAASVQEYGEPPPHPGAPGPARLHEENHRAWGGRGPRGGRRARARPAPSPEAWAGLPGEGRRADGAARRAGGGRRAAGGAGGRGAAARPPAPARGGPPPEGGQGESPTQIAEVGGGGPGDRAVRSGEGGGAVGSGSGGKASGPEVEEKDDEQVKKQRRTNSETEKVWRKLETYTPFSMNRLSRAIQIVSHNT